MLLQRVRNTSFSPHGICGNSGCTEVIKCTELSSRPVWLIYKYQCSLFTQTCKQQKVNNTAQLGLTNRLLLFHFRTWGVLDISQKLYWQQTQEGYEVTLTLSSLHGNRMHGVATRGNGHETSIWKEPTESLPQVWLDLAIFVNSTTATSLCSESTFHPRIWKHTENRLQIFAASFANYPTFTCKETEGLQIATCEELRFY